MTQMCPNCEGQLLLINGGWRHMHTDAVHACWTKHEIERGYAIMPEPEAEPEHKSFVSPDVEASLLATLGV